jgi:hypothetical protein
MGQASSAHDESNAPQRALGGITGGAAQKKTALPKLPPNAVKSSPDDYPFIEVRSL